MTTAADPWWRASAGEWAKVAGIMIGGLGSAVGIVLAIVFVMTAL